MTTPTEPNFEQRITALEKEFLDLIGRLRLRSPRETLAVDHACGAIIAACAVARDQARRPEGEE